MAGLSGVKLAFLICLGLASCQVCPWAFLYVVFLLPVCGRNIHGFCRLEFQSNSLSLYESLFYLSCLILLTRIYILGWCEAVFFLSYKLCFFLEDLVHVCNTIRLHSLFPSSLIAFPPLSTPLLTNLPPAFMSFCFVFIQGLAEFNQFNRGVGVMRWSLGGPTNSQDNEFSNPSIHDRDRFPMRPSTICNWMWTGPFSCRPNAGKQSYCGFKMAAAGARQVGHVLQTLPPSSCSYSLGLIVCNVI